MYSAKALWRDALVAIGFVAIMFTYAFCSDAQAQVVQPQYVRPSKGVSVLAFPGSDGKGLPPSTALTYSSLFDFSAFEAVQVFVSARTTSGTVCSASFSTISVIVTGSFTKTGAGAAGGFFALTDPYAFYTKAPFASSSDITYSIGALPTYLQLAAVTGTNADATCRLQVNIIPDPFVGTLGVQGRTQNGAALPVLSSYPVLVGGSDYQGINSTARTLKVNSDGTIAIGSVKSNVWDYENTTPVTIATGGTATRILTVDSGLQGARFQNIGTVPVYCGPALATTTSAYQFSLKASASPDDGSSL